MRQKRWTHELVEGIFSGAWEKIRVGSVRAFDEATRHPEKAVKFFRDLADALEARQRLKETIRGSEPAKEKGGPGDPGPKPAGPAARGR